jgi:epoxide hydrolase
MQLTRRKLLKTTCAAAATGLLAGVRKATAQDGIQPFQINFQKSGIFDLYMRIDRTRWPEIPFETGWSAGTNVNVLRELAQYWRQKYDWFAIQDELNKLPHFKTSINGDGIHFIHFRGNNPGRRFPILLLHGWPGSFIEFVDGAKQLSGRFDLVIPSLPGFVFSDAPKSPGMHGGKIGEQIHLLMKKLGYERYGIQGGDWGAIIGIEMTRRNPASIAGLHLNFCTEAPPPPEGVMPSEQERTYRSRMAAWRATEAAYLDLQSSRPQTLAYGLQDSPVGALAWILEKFWAWSEHTDDLWKTFTRDKVLTNVSLYWMSGHILSAARVYYENRQRQAQPAPQGKIAVPTGFAHFPAEFAAPPREVLERVFTNLTHYTEQPRGGHFAAMEQPDLWANDVATFFSSV